MPNELTPAHPMSKLARGLRLNKTKKENLWVEQDTPTFFVVREKEIVCFKLVLASFLIKPKTQ